MVTLGSMPIRPLPWAWNQKAVMFTTVSMGRARVTQRTRGTPAAMTVGSSVKMPSAQRGNRITGTDSTAIRVRAWRRVSRVASRTRSRRPAPWFCPTMIIMLIEMPSVGRKTKPSSRVPAPKAAMASVP